MVDPMSLFEKTETENLRRAQPLAARMRPQNLDEFVGQKHFLGEGKLLRRLLHADRLTSVIFYGPPGTGKTTLARRLVDGSEEYVFSVSATTRNPREGEKNGIDYHFVLWNIVSAKELVECTFNAFHQAVYFLFVVIFF